jgi:alkaline phosphatase D
MSDSIRFFAAAEFLFASAVAAMCISPVQATLIQFGSCNKQDRLNASASMFNSIASVESDVFIWLGDTIYTDKVGSLFSSQANDIETVRQQFKAWKETHSNEKLKNSTNLLMGVWDDHDFGINDGGSEHAHKSETQQIFLDYLGVSADSPRRMRQGVYSSEVIGDIGRRVRIILLDVRFHRDPVGSDGDLLGSEQWLWLERELRSEIRADMTIIGSGIQVLNDWRPSENWGRFPSERNRLLRLLGESSTTGVLFISGDVHFAELSEIKCNGGSRHLVDFTSSGISHSLDEEVNHFVRPWVLSTPLPARCHPHRTYCCCRLNLSISIRRCL